MKQTRLDEKEIDFEIGDIVKLKNPILKSDIGKLFRVVNFYDSENFGKELVFCRLITNEKEFGHYPFIPSIIEKVNEKESRFICSLTEDLEKI